MKKLYMLLIMTALLLAPLFSFTVSTSRGDIELTIPDDLTLEEAYVEMAHLYLEERWDHEKLLEESALLTKELDIYIEENKKLRAQYTSLLNSYTKIDELYLELTKVDPVSNIITGNASYDLVNRNVNLALAGGWCFYEALDITAGLTAAFEPSIPRSTAALNLSIRYLFK